MIDGMSGVASGDTIRLTVIRDPDRYCLSVDRARWCGLGPPTLGTGWTLFYSDGSPPSFKTCLSVLWVAILVLPFGFWARPRWSGAIGLTAITGALLSLPTIPAVGADGAPVYLGLALGVAVGQGRPTARWSHERRAGSRRRLYGTPLRPVVRGQAATRPFGPHRQAPHRFA